MKRKISILLICFTVICLPLMTRAFAEDPGYYDEPYRNQDSSAKNSYAVNIEVKNDVVKFIKFVDGKGYDLATYNDEGNLNLQTNTDYHLKVVTAGDSIKAYLGDKLVIDTKDRAYKEGYFGLNVWDSTTVFNNVKSKSNKGGKDKD